MDIEKYIQQNPLEVISFHPHFNQALNEMVLAGGKRFRPQLLLSIVDEYAPLLHEGALPVAYALEVFHTYSLIHDDLPSMDNAALRRGHPTLHVRYDEVTATLAGDALNTQAFGLIADAALSSNVKIELIKTLASDGGIGGMIIGQAIDCHFENTPLKLDEVKFLHIHKTAKLIAASLKMGAIIAGIDAKMTQKLYQLGIDLGLLFQIQDDIIDETQSSEDAGKTTGNDGDKNSFVNIIGLEKSYKEADKLAQKIEDDFSKFDPKLQNALHTIMKKYLYRHKG
ncbi:MAG: polyprenyl synthetase family protein [Campylobacterota bacterium]